MRPPRFVMLLAALLLAVSVSFAQNGKYTPFTVDADNVVRLKIPDAPITKKYGQVFKEHNRDIASVSDWDGVIQQIIGEKDTDLLLDSEFSFDTDDNNVIITASSKEGVDRLMKALRPTITSTQQLSEFLTRLDQILQKKKK